MPSPIITAYALNSWPSVIGTASWFSVRPIFSTSANSLAFALSAGLQFAQARRVCRAA